MNEQRTLNQMTGFKKGFEATGQLQDKVGDFEQSSEEYLAFALGALARVYGSVSTPEDLWELRKKVWNVEEKLGEFHTARLKSEVSSSSDNDPAGSNQ